ncbi:hypothetical protein J6590_017949 [Homalodisca vitripennis]|nr:hypothetical protein J6590_017949 [Homalodisca vitripennis]
MPALLCSEDFNEPVSDEIGVDEECQKILRLDTCDHGYPGDSHAQYITELLREIFNSELTGLCKPRARLCNVVDYSLTPPMAGTYCEVLIVRTNDLAAGEQQSIYCNLVSNVTTKPSNVSLVIYIVPHCHDPPEDDDINQETALANAYIQELATRHNF